jgi:hypothetical protein
VRHSSKALGSLLGALLDCFAKPDVQADGLRFDRQLLPTDKSPMPDLRPLDREELQPKDVAVAACLVYLVIRSFVPDSIPSPTSVVCNPPQANVIVQPMPTPTSTVIPQPQFVSPSPKMPSPKP